jgi:hypothetical protein
VWNYSIVWEGNGCPNGLATNGIATTLLGKSSDRPAFRGGFRLWHLNDVPTLSGDEKPPPPGPPPLDWRLI